MIIEEWGRGGGERERENRRDRQGRRAEEGGGGGEDRVSQHIDCNVLSTAQSPRVDQTSG